MFGFSKQEISCTLGFAAFKYIVEQDSRLFICSLVVQLNWSESESCPASIGAFGEVSVSGI